MLEHNHNNVTEGESIKWYRGLGCVEEIVAWGLDIGLRENVTNVDVIMM